MVTTSAEAMLGSGNAPLAWMASSAVRIGRTIFFSTVLDRSCVATGTAKGWNRSPSRVARTPRSLTLSEDSWNIFAEVVVVSVLTRRPCGEKGG